MIEARSAAAKSFYKRFFKIHFFKIYKNDNYIAYYNACQQYKDYFATAKTKKPNRILFTASFFQNHINF